MSGHVHAKGSSDVLTTRTADRLQPQAQQLPLPAADRLDLSDDLRRRVELTVSCRDADALPKVPDAGEIKVERGVRVQVMHEGTRIVAGCYHGVWMGEIIRRLRGHHEPQEELVVHRIMERLRLSPSRWPAATLELGSFWAYYSMWAARAGGARTVLVEPDPANLEAGRANLALNGLEARSLHAAVGGEHGSRMRLVCESDGIERELPVVTVAGVLEGERLSGLDLLLVDVQGPEHDVLARAEPLLRAGRIRFVVVSTHHHAVTGDPLTHQHCLALLEEVGAHIVAEHTVAESFSGDGLIAASLLESDRDLVVPVSFSRSRDCLQGQLEHDLAAAWRELGRL